MPEAIFRWIDCTDKRLPRELERRPETVTRVAHLTDPHVPSETKLFARLMDLVRDHGSVGSFSKEISALSNELGHRYRSNPERYTNILKKTLFGLHSLDVDHLILTGDLAHCGLATEFVEMRAVLELTDWWGEDKMTVVPGNHDRFNLYEHMERTSMEDFYPVVSPKEPRFKALTDEIVMLEVDTNRHPDDPHVLDQWLPTTAGLIYPEVAEWVHEHGHEVEGKRLITLIHHHVSADWYPPEPVDFGGLMDPVDGIDALMEAVEAIDPRSLILHGHIHDVMPVDYVWGGTHRVSCPGGFHQQHTLNVIDFDADRNETITQVEVRL
ncbi:MAG: metallophosphoesterase [Bradymonadaceae bacterium]